MFNFKRALGLAILSAAAVLSGCGGGSSGSQEPLAVCTDGLVLNQATNQCETRPPVCPAGFQFPDDLVVDETTTTADCVPVPYAGPDPVYLPAENEAVIYYNRQHVDADYSSSNIYRWNGCPGADIDWEGTLANFPGPNPVVQPRGIDPVYGAYYVFNISAEAQAAENSCGNYIINIGGNANQSADLQVTFKGEQPSPWYRTSFFIASDTGDNATGRVSSGTPICLEPAADSTDVCRVPEPPVRVLKDFAAHWLDASTFAYNIEGVTEVEVYVSPNGGFEQDGEGAIQTDNGTYLLGTLQAGSFTDAQREAAPYVTGNGWFAYSFSGDDIPTVDEIKEALKGHLLFALRDGEILRGTFVQTHEVLDALYTAAPGSDTSLAESSDLGVVYGDSGITVSVWAPTAQTMAFKSYSAGFPKFVLDTVPMSFDANTGIWSINLPASANGTFYRYELRVIDQTNGSVQLVQTTDPYSTSLSVDGLYSHIVNLSDPALKPDGWDSHEIPTIASQEQARIYEGHIRDFSARDASTSEANRGKYLAFTEESVPVQHLRELTEAGLTHFHMLPAFDIASVVEAEDFQANLDDPLEGVCAFRPLIQACLDFNPTQTVQAVIEALTASNPLNADAEELLRAVAEIDAFNWGYDPQHFNAPEGSYASDPEGATRILEFRAMVKALHDIGLRVVMDVVYNHTNASGLSAPKSNFDKLVPGYYFRRGIVSGGIERATCCEDTASENRMMAKFVEDSLVQWADQYKIDAFRFDLMAYHPKELIESSLAAVREVDADNFFYGEGWTVAGSSTADERFTQANQPNMAGTGVGTFNDVMRNPLHDMVLFEAAKAANDDDPETTPSIGRIDSIRVGLAGNLSNYRFYNAASSEVMGSTAGAYGADPEENVAHVTVHDNWTLWDYLHLEGNYSEVTADWSLDERARAHMLTLSIPMFSQGISFFHMGSDILRSKSMDRNSFNSGDWFNYVDFTQTTNNWAVANPWDVGAESNRPTVELAFNDMESKPDAPTIALASDRFNEFLRISSASPLFRLQTADDINARVGFHNQGLFQTPGLIVMSIDDGTDLGADAVDIDPALDAVVVVFNGTDATVQHSINTAEGFELHPIHAASIDSVVRESSFSSAVVDEVTVGTFSVPALTTAVFIKSQSSPSARGVGLSRDASPAMDGTVPNPFGEGEGVFIRGNIIDWANPAPDEAELAYNGDGTFTGFFETTAGDYLIKIASQSWGDDTNPTPVNFGGENSGDALTLGVPISLVSPGNDLGLPIPADGEYRFDLNAAVDPTAPELTVRDARGFGDERIFLRGGMLDWANPSPDSAEIVYAGRGIYERVITIETAGDYAFKIASQSWGDEASPTPVDFGGTESGVVVPIGTPTTLATGVADNNLTASFEADDYLFRVDTSNPQSPVLTIVLDDPYAETPIFLRGAMLDWANPSPDNAELVSQGGAVYVLDWDFDVPDMATSYGFKIASQSWGDADMPTPVDLGGTMSGVVVEVNGGGVPLATGVADNNLTIEIPVDGTYRFTLDQSSGTPVLSVEDVTP